MTLETAHAMLTAALAEHPAPWRPDGDRYIRRGVLSMAPDGDPDGTHPEDRDIVDANGDAVVRRDCGIYEPHGATYRFIIDSPMLLAAALAAVEGMAAARDTLRAQLTESETRRDAACRGNVRLAAALEAANKRIAELEAQLTATRLAFVESPGY